MVSYYNTLSYSQKHSAANLAYTGGQPWQWTTNYHSTPNHQFLGEIEAPHAHPQMYYNPHHMFHPPTGTSSEWHSPTSSADNFPQSTTSAHQMLQQHHIHSGAVHGGGSASSASSGSSSASAAPVSGNTQLNETSNSINEQQQHIAEGLHSPPITVSGSEISSPGAPASSSSPHHAAHHMGNNTNNNSSSTHNNNTAIHNNNNNRSSPVKAQYYDWMKKPSYPAQPTPGTYVDCIASASTTITTTSTATSSFEDLTELLDFSGKTRTKDKYRVVYTDFQRLELEKEYCTSRYITIRRKTELAQTLTLSERQVKIWFQNRRAKERKQNKKGNDPTAMGVVQHGDYANLMDTKPKMERGMHLQHPLHSMSSMTAISMPTMSLHHHLHSHHPLTVSAAHSHQLHQSAHAHMSAAAAASVGSLSM